MVTTELGLEVEETLQTTLEARGIYTADRCPAGVRRAIVALLARGLGKQTVAQLLGVAWETVRAVEFAEASSLRDQKRGFSDKLRLVIDAGFDDMIERIRSGRLKLSALDLCMLTDKWLLLNGEATERVEHVEDPRVRAFLDLAAQMGSAAQEKPAKGLVLDAEPVPSAPSDRVAECHPVTSDGADVVTVPITPPGARQALGTESASPASAAVEGGGGGSGVGASENL